MDTYRHTSPRRDSKSGGEVAEQSTGLKRFGKADIRYWEGKLFHEGFSRDGRRIESPNWSVRIQHAGRREAFALDTPNKAAGAGKARDIFQSLKGAGWEDTLVRYKQTVARPNALDASVGDLLREVEKVAGIRAKTFADYCKAFRMIVAAIFKIEGGRDKFNPHTGGRQKWVEQIGAIKLAEVTPDKIQAWKLSFLKRAGADPASQRRARISVNSVLRQAKGLFSKNVLRFITLKLPQPLPFEGVIFEPRQSMRYRSTIQVVELIGDARRELASGIGTGPEQYKVFLLSLCAGLRRNEIDKLEWAAFDFGKCVIRIQATDYLRPKSEDSHGDVEIDPEVAAVFAEFKKSAGGSFVIESDRLPITDATYSTYRCEKIFSGLVAWLREKGIAAPKPLHELRKEFGSTIANKDGIFAASRALRHADIAITSQHYADQTRRVTTGFGKMLSTNEKPR